MKSTNWTPVAKHVKGHDISGKTSRHLVEMLSSPEQANGGMNLQYRFPPGDSSPVSMRRKSRVWLEFQKALREPFENKMLFAEETRIIEIIETRINRNNVPLTCWNCGSTRHAQLGDCFPSPSVVNGLLLGLKCHRQCLTHL